MFFKAEPSKIVTPNLQHVLRAVFGYAGSIEILFVWGFEYQKIEPKQGDVIACRNGKLYHITATGQRIIIHELKPHLIS